MTFVSEQAAVHDTTHLGLNVIIEDDVEIAGAVEIGHNMVLRSGVRIGENSKILDGTVLRKLPTKTSLSATTGIKTSLHCFGKEFGSLPLDTAGTLLGFI
jgi:UDP-3-O-[3-hydroxymyristoyl] glucosamine N-acyltransferase